MMFKDQRIRGVYLVDRPAKAYLMKCHCTEACGRSEMSRLRGVGRASQTEGMAGTKPVDGGGGGIGQQPAGLEGRIGRWALTEAR